MLSWAYITHYEAPLGDLLVGPLKHAPVARTDLGSRVLTGFMRVQILPGVSRVV